MRGGDEEMGACLPRLDGKLGLTLASVQVPF